MRRLCSIMLAIVAVLASVASARAEIYRWTDDAGVVHYDDDIARVPESQRADARVYRSKLAARDGAMTSASGPTQSGLATALARELGLLATDLQDPLSVLQVVGIYPATGWHPGAALTPAVVQEVVTTTRAAARARRLSSSEGGAEAAVLRIAAALGVSAPPASAPPDPPPPPTSIVIAPNIVIEPAPPQVVVVRVEPQPVPVLSQYPTFGYGYSVPFYGPVPGRQVSTQVPERITPLFNPAGRLHGPSVTPLGFSSFTRPMNF